MSGDTQYAPIAAGQMFGKKHHLPGMVGNVCELPMDCLRDGMMLRTDRDRAIQVGL